MAHGLCDNLLLAIYLSARCPVLLAPAMDLDMLQHPATKSNLEKIKGFGNIIIDPTYGELASGLTGTGRMAEPEEIFSTAGSFLSSLIKNSQEKKCLLPPDQPTKRLIRFVLSEIIPAEKWDLPLQKHWRAKVPS